MIGRAVLLMVNIDDPATEGAMWEGPFEERDDDAPHQHPIARALALWESTKNDWPEWTATVVSNQRAKNLRAADRMRAMGFDYEEELAEYEAKNSSTA